MEKLKFAQELIKASPSVMAGFNMFIYGHPPITFSDGFHDAGERIQGYEFAQKMAKEDGIAFTHVFKCESYNCYPFQYGGFFVCNSCGGKGVDKEWWKIKVEKDGNAFCCHALDFVNLQESNKYAFGNTFEEAIKNYGSIVIGLLHVQTPPADK